MGHNISHRKQEEIERSRRVAELTSYLVPGWRIDATHTRIVPVETVLGAHHRGQLVLLRCRRTDCRRRVEIDLRSAVQAGFGDRPIAWLVQSLRCQHWNGCQLEEASCTYPRGVPLVAYLQHDDVLVAITCAHCRTRWLLPPRRIIAGLKAAGRGDGASGILEMGTKIRGPCRRCHRSGFEAEVIWPKRP